MQIYCILKNNICTMNKIGFQNFRRFQNFPAIECSGITFLVGRNNAGKSTLVKAIILIDNYLKSNNYRRFSFGNNILEDANIVTFGRAKTINSGIDTIEFTYQIDNYLIDIILSGEDDKSYANVLKLIICDVNNGIKFLFDFTGNILHLIKETGSSALKINLQPLIDLDDEIDDIEVLLMGSNLKKTSKEYIEYISRLDALKQKKDNLINNNNLESNSKEAFNLHSDFGRNISLVDIVLDSINDITNRYENEFKSIQEGNEPSADFEDLRAFKEFDPIIAESIYTHFDILIKDFSVAYLGASSTKQSALFAIRDKNNALAQTIHEYVQYGIKKGEEEYLFVIKWMKEFEIGSDFEINIHAGEAYEVIINSNNNSIQLADKGMGSIQAMLLILRLACVIKRLKIDMDRVSGYKKYDGNGLNPSADFRLLLDNTTVIMEEPELNLHPALQSKITDLLYFTHQNFKINFIIETHSEYILRRSQVLVIENDLALTELSLNPFKSYYFSNSYSLPYSLNYNPDGTFDKNFGKGFFDEASGITLELIKLKRQKNQ